MKILAIEKDLPGVDWSNAQYALEQETRQVYQIYLAGLLREIYFNESHNAVLVLECESKQQALEILGSLPLVRKKMIEFDVMELRPYDGYLRIIGKD
ncbi:MAG: hypothetical protein Q8862_00445 [Bacteroidota bacterium]|nr:hypothetical protein [Bacteroidota bacterium]MDP4206787.1 hypothetical protein [Bacteroidota bacterium]